jgi:hypothetical protein
MEERVSQLTKLNGFLDTAYKKVGGSSKLIIIMI